MDHQTIGSKRNFTLGYVLQAGILQALVTGRAVCRQGLWAGPGVFQWLWPVVKRRLAKRMWIVFLLLLPLKSYGQWLQVSPTSVPLWGQSPRVAKVSLGYRSVELVYLYGFKTMYDHQDRAFGGEYVGIFWNPLTVEKGRFKASGGVGYFFREYPTTNGTHINFSLKLLFRINERISIQYGHISNGFGLLNNLNPGVDNIGLVIAF